MAEEKRPRPHEADPAEPAGDGDPAAEAAMDEATERAPGLEAEPAAGPDESAESVSVPEAASGDAGEADAAGGEAPGGEPAPEQDEDPLARAQRERDEYLDLARRTQADFENYRKRAAREAAAAGERAKAGLVRELLSVVDNLERALASAREGEEHLAEGVRLVHAELLGVLQRSGVEAFDPAGEPFDPERHEALSVRQQEGTDAGVVLDVVEKGYTMNGAVLRPARVVVSG